MNKLKLYIEQLFGLYTFTNYCASNIAKTERKGNLTGTYQYAIVTNVGKTLWVNSRYAQSKKD